MTSKNIWKSVLASLQVPTDKGLQELRKAVLDLPKQIQVKSCSAVYKRVEAGKSFHNETFLFVVLNLQTEFDQWQLQSELALVTGTWLILTYDQIVSLSPQLTLPNPTLFEDKALLRCAFEADSEFIHPVLGQSLNELIRSVHSFEKIEFFAQGRSIL
jgi:7,8-dihydro-6-hydroxymethylpterin-pyrophosphokinase